VSLLKRIFGRASPDTAEADLLIDRLVNATDRRLAFVKGYRESLRGPVIAARDRMRERVALIPGPVEASAAAWSRDDTVRALFARAADVPTAFSNDAGVREFFALNPGSDCVALLGLEKRERRVLAAALHGDSVQSEVARTTVSFAEPQVLAPGGDEASVREELVRRALEFLALRALERVGALRMQRQELEKDRALLTAQLRLATRRGAGFGPMGATAVPPATELERDLERTVAALEASASQAILPSLLEEMAAAFEAPERWLTIEPGAIALDAMNFVVDADSAQAVKPRIAILTLAHRGPFGVLLVRFPRSELKAAARFADAKFV
jgi:hypothetical protein